MHWFLLRWIEFQSTLPCGSDFALPQQIAVVSRISIHAPSRERRYGPTMGMLDPVFQSTLPHGSDSSAR